MFLNLDVLSSNTGCQLAERINASPRNKKKETKKKPHSLRMALGQRGCISHRYSTPPSTGLGVLASSDHTSQTSNMGKTDVKL